MKRFMSAVLFFLITCAAAAVTAQDDVITPADNLVVEGIPKVPATLAEEIDRYTEFRGAGQDNWHPTRREMLISTRFGNTTQVHLVKFPGGARTQLTFFRDAVVAASYQPTRGDYFIFTKGAGGNENY